MKTLLLGLLFSLHSWAGFKKPLLLARYSGSHHWNAQDGLYCFSSEPLVVQDAIYLGCRDEKGAKMMEWGPKLTTITESGNDLYYSSPMVFGERIGWYEFDEGGARRLFTYSQSKLSVVDLKNNRFDIDNFIPFKNNSWIYRSRSERAQILLWNEGKSSVLFEKEVAYIFPPIVSEKGTILMKTREQSLDDSSPDQLWLYNGTWKKIFEDHDANQASPWLSFRHQYALDGERVVILARDQQGEALLLIENGFVREIARTGGDLKSFDFFSPKMKDDLIVFRGVDSKDRKALWFFSEGKLERLITQGDVLQTDVGPARVNYQDDGSIFWGAPGIGPQGEVILQGTLVDIDFPTTLIGIGLIKFEKQQNLP